LWCGGDHHEPSANEVCDDVRLSELSSSRSRRGHVLAAAIRILREYERASSSHWVASLGEGPGLIILIPFVQQMVKVDLRVVVQDVRPRT